MKNNTNEQLLKYGWNTGWDTAFAQQPPAMQQLTPARVIAQFSHSYNLMTESGEHSAVVTGKFEFNAAKRGDYPAVGDWVIVEMLPGENRSVIHAVLPRRTSMVRKAAGNVIEDQVIGANIDYLFIVNALNQDFNIRKIERYLIAAWESGAQPIVLLTKADLCEQPLKFIAEVENIAPDVPVHSISAHLNQGKEELALYLKPGNTIGITGSSGVGKSTLLNWLADDELQRTKDIREGDAKGRHTTTHRELFLLGNGALIMDTPGMRELQLWEAQEGWQHAFADIEELANQCKYRDCRHEGDQGCAVIGAVNSGELDPKRVQPLRAARRSNKSRGLEGRSSSASISRSIMPWGPPSGAGAPARSRRGTRRLEIRRNATHLRGTPRGASQLVDPERIRPTNQFFPPTIAQAL